MPSNQGRDLDPVLNNVGWDVIHDASKAMWTEVRAHPSGASCECPLAEALARLAELGYVLHKVDTGAAPGGTLAAHLPQEVEG